MIKKLAAIIVILIVALLGFAATRPDTFRIERRASIKAPPDKIFPLIDDFHRWGAWSPWEKLDPEMKRTYSGAESGPGAVYEWAGNSEVGKGRMEILETSPPSRVTIKLDFLEPFEGHSTAEFTLAPEGDATNVTWAMFGSNSYFEKVIGVFLSMDSMVGKDFEKGLADMKRVAER